MDTNKHLLSDENYKDSSNSSIPLRKRDSSDLHDIVTSEDYQDEDMNSPSKQFESISIRPIPSLIESNIIDSINFCSERKILNLKFSDNKYSSRTIILSTNLAHIDWMKFANACRKTLEKKRIEKNDIDSILNSIDHNFEIILGKKTDIITNYNSNKSDFRNASDLLLEAARKKIDLLFVDQYNEAFTRVYVNNDHYENIPIHSRKFASLLSKFFIEKYEGQVVNRETKNNVIETLQAQAEFGKSKYDLSLRVAEYDGDFYYDLTDEKHRCIKISKNDGIWQVLDKTPIPLFRRHNQVSQDEPSLVYQNIEIEIFQKSNSFSKKEDPLDEFLSKMTNIKQDNSETRLLIQVALISYFIPNIPHPIMILHGSAGSAKSTLQFLLKNIIDPAKPSLLTLHNNSTEFIQQLAHNYLATYDNLKFTPYWLADEVCKAVTGVGQTKRLLYTDDEDKIYEYKHCLIFNGINIAFSEPDVLDRSIVIHLDEIEDDKRRTEKEILNEFYSFRPFILKFIFDTLSKAIVIKDKVLSNTKRLPRMADFALWGEAILQTWGYKEGKFLKIYYDNMGRQNDEVIDSHPIAFAIRKLIEESPACSSSSNIIFEGTPMELLEHLNRIAAIERINTYSKEWPKDTKWLVRRINIVKSNLHKALDAKITIERDAKKNTSKILVVKNVSIDSNDQRISPNSNDLSPYLDKMNPQNNVESDIESINLQINPKLNGQTGYNGDILDENFSGSNIKNKDSEILIVDHPKSQFESHVTNRYYQDSNILYDSNLNLYYCKQHPNIQNIHSSEIVRHRQLSPDHNEKSSYLNRLRDI